MKFVVSVFGSIPVLFFATTAHGLELPINQFYAGGALGIYSSNFSQSYMDQSDVIPQNVSDDLKQTGYTGSFGTGYTHFFSNHFFLGGEINGNLNSQSAQYASDANSSAFSDTTAVKKNLDFLLVPGMMLNDSVAAYLKLGVSIAKVDDSVLSPIDTTPTYGTWNQNKRIVGFACGIGAKKYFTRHTSMFAQYTYYDYRNTNFPAFQNFTSTYTHAIRINSGAFMVGANYLWG